MTKDEALKLALEAFDSMIGRKPERVEQAITAIKEALEQPEQEPVAYDKTEMNCFVQDLYDEKMREGKHGNYETIFHVVHQAIKRVPPQRTWVGLTDEEIDKAWRSCDYTVPWEQHRIDLARAIEDALRKKNNA